MVHSAQHIEGVGGCARPRSSTFEFGAPDSLVSSVVTSLPPWPLGVDVEGVHAFSPSILQTLLEELTTVFFPYSGLKCLPAMLEECGGHGGQDQAVAVDLHPALRVVVGGPELREAEPGGALDRCGRPRGLLWWGNGHIKAYAQPAGAPRLLESSVSLKVGNGA